MKKCITCEKLTTNSKFCSRSCAAKENNKIPKRKRKTKCVKCDEITKSYKNTLCEKHHQEYLESKISYTQELTLSNYWNKKSLQNLHASSKNTHIRILGRKQHKLLLEKPCANCGYEKHVELCHIKAIKDFPETAKLKEVNSPDNVIQLCPNCHWEFDKNLLTLEEIRNKLL